tara:strand:- start:493 stop:690 length:198 start_codon:yes stop_codon:yes gene_type:complete
MNKKKREKKKIFFRFMALRRAGSSSVTTSRFNAKRDGKLMNKNASEIGGLLDTVRSQLEDLARGA